MHKHKNILKLGNKCILQQDVIEENLKEVHSCFIQLRLLLFSGAIIHSIENAFLLCCSNSKASNVFHKNLIIEMLLLDMNAI